MAILFLCSCSNRKLAGGESAYEADDSLPAAIPRRGQELLEARTESFKLIAKGARSSQGKLLRELPYNTTPNPLVHGPDLGGEHHGIYMPAWRRYRGRFHQEVDPDEQGSLTGSPHHWLIISTLYGLLTPQEPIQRYSCHTLDDPGFSKIWARDGLLTSLVLHYVNAFNIKLIVDLMADSSYHPLFDWERLASNARVLRAFGEQNVGPALLPALGWLAREQLLEMPPQELLAIDEHKTYITDYEDVALTRTHDSPPPGFLGEDDERVREERQPEPEAERQPDRPATESSPRGPDDECVILPKPREIPVTSDGHRTILGHSVTRIRDLPPAARRPFDEISRAAEALSVELGEFRTAGRRKDFVLDIAEPGQAGSGTIDGKIRGPGKIGGTQHFRIRVTPGRERATHEAILTLLEKPR